VRARDVGDSGFDLITINVRIAIASPASRAQLFLLALILGLTPQALCRRPLRGLKISASRTQIYASRTQSARCRSA
jgi:hypothetical protein